MKIDQSVGIITGGTSGIGLASAEALLAKGARLLLIDLRDEKNVIASFTKQFGAGRVFFQQCNVINQKQLASAFSFVVSKFGRLDFLVNSAGIGESTGIHESTTDEIPQDWVDTIDIDVTALVNATRLSVRQMIKQNTEQGKKQGGVIINIASVGGVVPMTFAPVYSAAKFAVVGFTRSLEKLNTDYGIRVNCLCPGFVRTQLVDKGASALPDMQQAVKLMGVLEPPVMASAIVSMIENKDSNYPGGAVISVSRGCGELRHEYIPLNKKNTYNNNPYIKVIRPHADFNISKL